MTSVEKLPARLSVGCIHVFMGGLQQAEGYLQADYLPGAFKKYW